MAKLFFRYSSMGAGKSLDLLKTCYNYEERGKNALIFTSAKDVRYGENKVKSRIGLEKKAIGVNKEFNIFDYVKNIDDPKPDCILIDEVQFFNKEHIYQLCDIVDILDIPVIAYGLRIDFKLVPFEGSSYLLALADEIEELKTLCTCCEKKATLNIRYTIKENINGEYKKIITQGEQVLIGGNDSYMPLCRKCYKKLLNITNQIENI
jgi:thymidine kinase